MDDKTKKLKAIDDAELEQVSGGKTPNISLDQARKYFEDGVKAHLEMQAAYYYKHFYSRFSKTELLKMESDFRQRFGCEPKASKYYPNL